VATFGPGGERQGVLFPRCCSNRLTGPILTAAKCLLIIGLGVWLVQATEVNANPYLQGTFLQLQRHQLEWRNTDWNKLFDYFNQLKLSRIVIQWAAYDDVEFYHAAPGAPAEDTTIESILKLGDDNQMRVFVGLAYQSAFWEEAALGVPRADAYLRNARDRSLAIASQLAPMVNRHPCFEGWYLTEEIDDGSWVTPEARLALFDHLHSTASRLHELTPGHPVALSGFSNGRTEPHSFAAFWNALLGATGVDVVFFQDGIGAGKLNFAQLPPYLSALQRVVESRQRQLDVVIETFRQVAGPPIDDRPFRAEPASLDRIRQQMAVAAPYSEHLIAFSVPEYMTPLGDLRAASLFAQYLKEVLPGR
jgi:Domain of unknown function (DUF4434)